MQMNTLGGLVSKFSPSQGTLFYRSVHFFNRIFLRPKSSDEDSRRKEFILNVILLGTIALLLEINISVWYRLLHHPDFKGALTLLPLVLLVLFGGLLAMSRKGFFIAASYALLSIYFLAISYAIFYWGANLPQAILSYAVIIIMASILINSSFGVVATVVIMCTLSVIGILQLRGIITPQLYWKQLFFKMNDIIIFCMTYSFIMVVSWLSNREIEKSLQRARKSEADLKEERDLLEIRVEERTQELRQIQLQKISELSRFVEFGRLAFGLFHDLVNPLTALSLNIQQLKDEQSKELITANQALDQAISASRRMEDFIVTIRKQIRNEDSEELFFPEAEIKEVLQLLSYSIKERGVRLHFKSGEPIEMYGSPFKFRQIVINLVSNALESYQDLALRDVRERVVEVGLKKNAGFVSLEVKDNGVGIAQDTIDKIFEPFFTTKHMHKGSGIGLSTVKDIVEKQFRGSVRLTSTPGTGTVFLVMLPLIRIN